MEKWQKKVQKVFGLFEFGHFFCPFSKSRITFGNEKTAIFQKYFPSHRKYIK
uniref:Uncharacterized protein n=1 Tax=viral metagenome TaxID=1070528 RepID=A0A6C0KYQ2_9ZZZZ